MTGPPVKPAVPCALCGNEVTVPLFEKDNCRFFKCAACAFQFNVSSTNANLDQSLEDYEPAYLQYLDSSPVDRVNHESTIKWVERLVALDDPGVSLLDVGAGSGKWLRHIRANRRCHTAGLEPSDALFRAFGLDSLGVANLSLPEFRNNSDCTFDAVTAFDVIEHVADSVEFTRNLYKITKPGGYVFLSTPDVGSLVTRALGRHWYHYHRYHLSLFDPRSIARLGRDAGFVVMGVEHRGKRFSLGYLHRYLQDYLLRSKTRLQPSSNDGGLTVYLNLFDIMSVVWKKPG